jgi:hypothetical protein
LFTEDRHPKSDCADVGETNVLKAGKPAQSLKQGNQFMERNEVQTLRKLELVVNGLLIAVALLTIVGVAWGLDTQDIIAPPFASRH